MKKAYILMILATWLGLHAGSQKLVSFQSQPGCFSLVSVDAAPILVDPKDDELVKIAARLFQQDIESVTGKKPELLSSPGSRSVVIIGTLEKSSWIRKLVASRKLKTNAIRNQWEAFQVQLIKNPFKGVDEALVIAGSDRRGAAFGVFELSAQIGVSPWYWWADVPVKKQASLFIPANTSYSDAPKVKYRGIFINDEAPALSGWTEEKFGGFNHRFYEKVFELILRLKGNYLWPAMWGHAFYDDDPENINSADAYGIVIGTSHHEPLMRAHDEWRRYGNKQKWDYDSTEAGLKAFWREGMKRATNEKIVSIGMRGDGDAPMSRETATALLERIVKDQREIISDVTGKPASETPQLWALYKEVQDYYDKGMRVPDDVTLLLCDDNWGNIRKLPRIDAKPRKGGYGIYYHFDYVGGPRNYKWINTNPLPRVWEQMHLAYEYNVRQIWIVNVGDIKPMELPISFFLDYAWNPDRIGADDVQPYTEHWAANQFGDDHAREIGRLLASYAKYNGRRKPELLEANTYSIDHYDEANRVTGDYNQLAKSAEDLAGKLPAEYQDAYFQLVLHPIKASANLQEMYTEQAKNIRLYMAHDLRANQHGRKVMQLYRNDSIINNQYHLLKNGKWNHMMDQTHIGYTYWQQPPRQRMPDVRFVQGYDAEPIDSVPGLAPVQSAGSNIPRLDYPAFFEENKVISIEASHYSHAENRNGVTWKVLPDLGRTGDAVTAFPVTAPEQTPGTAAPELQYEVYTYSAGDFSIETYFSPTLNFHNTEEGLQYAIAVDNETPQILSINAEDKTSSSGIWNQWVAQAIIKKKTKHHIDQPGKHVIRYWMVNPGVVLQKLVADFGGEKSSYLGPPETMMKKDKY